MEFYEVIDRRKTSREWTDRKVDFAAIERIIEAGMKAPSWDHYRNWQFIVLHTKEEKENAFSYRNTPFLRVYGHSGEPCSVCGETLRRMTVGGRSSVYCPACQKGDL